MSKFKAYEKVCEYLADNPPKECPYCGGIPVPDYLSEERFMVCEECGARGPEKDTFITAATAWNERPTVWQDAEIDRLKARVAELERADIFWPTSSDRSRFHNRPIGAIQQQYGTLAPFLLPIELNVAARLPNQWAVIYLGHGSTEHIFPTKEEAEAFCQMVRAEKGNDPCAS